MYNLIAYRNFRFNDCSTFDQVVLTGDWRLINASIIITRQVTCATHHDKKSNNMNFQTGKDSKPTFFKSSRYTSCCRRFDLLVFAFLAQSFAAKIAVVTAHVVAGDRLTMTGVIVSFRWVASLFIQQRLVQDSVFAIVFWCFSCIKKLLGRTEM